MIKFDSYVDMPVKGGKKKLTLGSKLTLDHWESQLKTIFLLN